jgi:hypothetical protein
VATSFETRSEFDAFAGAGTFKMSNESLAAFTKLHDPDFSWQNYSGPCYVKGPGPPNPPAPPAPPPAPAPPPGKPCSKCAFEQGVHYPGNDIAHKKAKSQEECCNLCSEQVGCVKFAYKLEKGACTLKGKVGAA